MGRVFNVPAAPLVEAPPPTRRQAYAIKAEIPPSIFHPYSPSEAVEAAVEAMQSTFDEGGGRG